MASPAQWEEDSERDQHMRLEADRAILSFQRLIEGRRRALELRREAGNEVFKAYRAPGNLKTHEAKFVRFLGAYDPEEDRIGVRMWPIRRPVQLQERLASISKPPSSPRLREAAGAPEAVRSDKLRMTELLDDLRTAIKIDGEVLAELEFLRTEVFGLYELKVRFMSLLFSILSGGGRISATARNAVLGGNPGTGKTTFAAILSKLVVLLGWVVVDPGNQTVRDLDRAIELTEELVRSSGETEPGTPKRTVAPFAHGEVPKERGRYVLASSRENFVAGFSGMTALRTMRTIRESLGRVLFIDEAYALTTGPDDAYGLEALNTLVNWIPRVGSDRLGIFVLAGYVDRIRRDFFRRNEGLQSRFPHLYVLPNYSPVQLAAVFASELGEWKRSFPELEKLDQEGVRDFFVSEARQIAADLDLERAWEAAVPTRSRTGEEMYFAEFFSAFFGVFKIGNIRKLQNYIGAIEQRWARSRLMSTEEKTPEWFAAAKKDKVLTTAMMLDAMQEVLETMRDCDDESLSCDPRTEFAPSKAETW